MELRSSRRLARSASGSRSIKFIDEARIHVRSGNGGAGCSSFRREKHVPLGGPDGGNGGRGALGGYGGGGGGGTLLDYRYRRRHFAPNGRPGEGQDRSGKNGDTLVVRVPPGTQLIDIETDALLADLTEAGQRVVLCRGGRGGRGNAQFATASRRAPDYAQPGEAGEERQVQLVLKLLADVGLVGFPNAGKSTLVSRVSKARPKVADYPFTTLKPNLGVVRVDDERSFVIADMPGLIVGAADGAGLGTQFLKHIERSAIFVYLITQDLEPGRTPLQDYLALRKELGQHDPRLLDRPSLVVLSQCDRPDVREQFEQVREAIDPNIEVHAISAVTGDGLKPLIWALGRAVERSGRWT